MPTTTNEVLAGRDILAYTEPWVSTNVFPTDGAWGVAPGGAWTDSGYTKDGVQVLWRQQIQEYTVDQQLDPVVNIPLSRDLRFRANIGQVDMPDLVIATGGGSATATAAGSGTRGRADYILSGALSAAKYSVFYDCRNPISGEAGRFVGWKTQGVGDIDIHVHLPDIAIVNMEMKVIPDDSVTPARIAQFRILTPALP